MRLSITALLLFLFAVSAPQLSLAISPEEQLADPVLEQRARNLSQQLRCLVCQNQSIDESDADLAVDLRQDVRTQLLDGRNDTQILDAIRDQYGDYILLKPPIQKATYLLWAMPMILVFLAILLFWLYHRDQRGKLAQAGDIDNQAKNINQTDELAGHQPASADLAESTSGHLPRSQIILGIFVIGIISVFAYSQLGRPDITAQPLADRGAALQAAKADQAASQAMSNQALLEAQAKADAAPNSVDAQLVLALAAAQSGDFAIEQAALATALSLTGGNISIKAMMAEALSREADGLITLRARRLIEEILAETPDEPRALYLAGLAAFQDETYETALAYWTQLQTLSTADAPWQKMLSENITQAARAAGIPVPDTSAADTPGPDAEMLAAAADLSAADQQEMIQTMVASLEAKLADTPNDAEGWQRLIQSRRVLNDTDGLLRALNNAAAAFPNDMSAQLALLEELLQNEAAGDHIDKADVALRNLRVMDNDSAEYLFFNGHFANMRGQTSSALTSWQRLYKKLPKDTEFAKRLLLQIENLQAVN